MNRAMDALEDYYRSEDRKQSQSRRLIALMVFGLVLLLGSFIAGFFSVGI